MEGAHSVVDGQRGEAASPRAKRRKLTASSDHSEKPSTVLPVDSLNRSRRSRRKSELPPPLIFVGPMSTARTSIRIARQKWPLGIVDLTATDSSSASSGSSPPAWKFSACTESLRSYFKPTLGLNVDYYPQFFGRGDADTIFQQLDRELQPFFNNSQSELKMMGKVYKLPRKQTAFGDMGLAYSFSGMTVAANEWTPLVLKIKVCIENALGKAFNFVLVNRYKDGLDHIGEHRDNEEVLHADSPIAAVSFGQPRDFVFRHKDSRGTNAPRKDIQTIKINLAHGSLLVMNPPTNRIWYHSLPSRKNSPTPRISLTFRKMK